MASGGDPSDRRPFLGLNNTNGTGKENKAGVPRRPVVVDKHKDWFHDPNEPPKVYSPCVKIPGKLRTSSTLNSEEGTSTEKLMCGFCERPKGLVQCTVPTCNYTHSKLRVRRQCPNLEHKKQLNPMDSQKCPECRSMDSLVEIHFGPYDVLIKNKHESMMVTKDGKEREKLMITVLTSANEIKEAPSKVPIPLREEKEERVHLPPPFVNGRGSSSTTACLVQPKSKLPPVATARELKVKSSGSDEVDALIATFNELGIQSNHVDNSQIEINFGKTCTCNQNFKRKYLCCRDCGFLMEGQQTDQRNKECPIHSHLSVDVEIAEKENVQVCPMCEACSHSLQEFFLEGVSIDGE